MMAEAFITMPHGKKNKGKGTANTAIVLNSLGATLPIAVPGQLEESTRSAPNSPDRESRKKSKGFFKKHLKPKSPSHHSNTSLSDPECSPQARPRWLPFKGKKRRPSVNMNGTEDMVSSSESSPIEPEATPVEELPGRIHQNSNNGGCTNVPEIRVSSEVEGHEAETKELVSYEDIHVSLDPYRKNSESSRCSSGSGLVSVGTSGVGSLLSPSGDESYNGSDLESPLSPCSRSSSFTEDTPGEFSDSDPIDKDFPTLKSPSVSSNDNLSVTTPTPTSDSPSFQGDELISPTLLEGKELKKKKREKKEKKNVWLTVRNAVKIWSPFNVQFKKRYYPWVQLAGHEGNFMPGGKNGTILKKFGSKENAALQSLMEDSLRSFVPEFKQVVEMNGEEYVEMTDLLREFTEPAVMDIKMGIRTYLEEELGKKNALRNDMYLKMIDVDPNEPTPEEHAQSAITKPRYMQWRESLSSTSTLGFRVEGIKTTSGTPLKDFKKTRKSEDVVKVLHTYISENPSVKAPLLKRLLDIRAALEHSTFFSNNELIGSSLLFVYDSSGLTNINLIDFGKTTPLPPGVSITHDSEWVEGNHEDGYLLGLDNLIQLWQGL